MKIYQLLPTLAFGDAVSNDALALEKVIREMGYKTCRISCKYFNNSSDYTGKRRRIADIECGYSAKHRRFFKDD